MRAAPTASEPTDVVLAVHVCEGALDPLAELLVCRPEHRICKVDLDHEVGVPALIPVALANKLVSLSDFPSQRILMTFVRLESRTTERPTHPCQGVTDLHHTKDVTSRG